MQYMQLQRIKILIYKYINYRIISEGVVEFEEMFIQILCYNEFILILHIFQSFDYIDFKIKIIRSSLYIFKNPSRCIYIPIDLERATRLRNIAQNTEKIFIVT